MKFISKRAVVCLVAGASAVGALGFSAVGTGATTSLAGDVGVYTDYSYVYTPDERVGPVEVHPIPVKVPRACVHENGYQLFGRPIPGTGYPGVCA
jgi:hypothetical protein